MLTYKPKLIDELNRLNSKLEIELEEGDMIAAVEHDLWCPGENFDYSMMFWHDKGRIECGTNFPTRKEFYFDKDEFDDLSYLQKKEVLYDKLETAGEDYEDDPSYDIDFPWVSFDDQGNVDEKSNTEKSMNDWLKESTEWEDLEEAPGLINRYLPGIEIFEHLPEEDKLKYLDHGEVAGMVSALDGIKYLDGDFDEFSKILEKHNIPFYFKD